MGTLRFAVAMTTCNGAEFVGRQLASIRAQTRPPDVLFVGDDASTDDTRAAIDAFARSCAIEVVRLWHPARVGLRVNAQSVLTRAAEAADVVVLADQDDLWEPDKLATLAAEFEGASAPVAWVSDAELIGVDDRPLGRTLWQMVGLGEAGRRAIARGTALPRLLRGETLTGPTMAVTSDLVRAALPLPDATRDGTVLFHADGWLAVLAAARGRIAVESRALTRYRRHPAQMTAGAEHRGAARSRTRPDTRASGARAAKSRDLRVLAERVPLVAARVRAADDGWLPEARGEILAMESLLAARTAPLRTPGRWRAIARQWRAGAYTRFARGLRTALGDVLLPRPEGTTGGR